MAVLVFWVVNVVEPFLELVVLANLHWGQLGDGGAEFFAVVGVEVEDFGCKERGVQCIKNNLIVHRTANGERTWIVAGAVFGRY